jgi:hypothetical protein
MTLDEVRTMLVVIGLSGGMVLSSDDLDKLTEDRLELLSMAIPPLPQSAIPLDLMQSDMPERFAVSHDRLFDPMRLVGLFNFSDETRDLVLDLPDGAWHVFELWDERYRGVCSGAVMFDLVSPHASRLVALRAATGQPRLVGTTAHIGLGCNDVIGQEYALGELRLTLAPAGRRRRKLFFAGGTAHRATWLGEGVDLRAVGGASVVEIDVDTDGDLVITFNERDG